MKHLLLLLICSGSLFGQTPAEHAIKVDSLILISRNHTDSQAFGQAAEFSIAAETLALSKCGPLSAAYGSACFNKGRVFHFSGRYEEATIWYLKSKEIREKVLGTAHADYGKSLNNLAIVYDLMAQHEMAIPLYLDVLDLRARLFGKESDPYADVLSNLATSYMEMGQFEKAELYTLEALEIRGRVVGKNHSDYAASLTNLANLYFEMGNFSKAEAMYRDTKILYEGLGYSETSEFAKSVDNLGAVNQLLGRYEAAAAYFNHARSLYEKITGVESREYLNVLNHLALLYQFQKQYLRADSLYQHTLDIGSRVWGDDDLDHALVLQNYGELNLNMGQLGQAREYMAKSLAIYREKGIKNRFYTGALDIMNIVQINLNHHDLAIAGMIESAGLKRAQLTSAVRHLSDQELAAYTLKFEQSAQANYHFIKTDTRIAEICYDDLLFRKGFLLNTALQTRKSVLTDSATTQQYHLLKSYHRLLAEAYTKPESERQIFDEIAAKANNLEKELARTVAGYSASMEQTNWKAVQAVLGAEEAAIEFVRHPKSSTDDTYFYAALLVKSSSSAPEYIPLCDEIKLDQLIRSRSNLYQSSIRSRSSNQVNLDDLIWEPVEKAILGVKTIYFSPSGLLNRLNLGAVYNDDGNPLYEKYHFVQVGSTRQLTIPKTDVEPKGEALLLGGIVYDLDTTNRVAFPPEPETKYLASRSEPPFVHADSTIRGGSLQYLKWTAEEVNTVGKILTQHKVNTTTLMGREPTEGNLKSLLNSGYKPSLIHIATHGFFFPDPKTQPTNRTQYEPAFKTSDNPLIRSGLVLAGGNYAWKAGKPYYPGSEDELLTAYEVSQLDLRQTELVVLSACETGLGDISGDEGVYGLQRAFKIAGVKYLIMSLWQVPDFQTRELMTLFYQYWISEKLPLPDAFKKAQKAIQDKYEHPFFWAGFILVS